MLLPGINFPGSSFVLGEIKEVIMKQNKIFDYFLPVDNKVIQSIYKGNKLIKSIRRIAFEVNNIYLLSRIGKKYSHFLIKITDYKFKRNNNILIKEWEKCFIPVSDFKINRIGYGGYINGVCIKCGRDDLLKDEINPKTQICFYCKNSIKFERELLPKEFRDILPLLTEEDKELWKWWDSWK